MEYNDLEGIIHALNIHGVSISYKHDLVNAKIEKIKKYLDYSKEIGVLNAQS